MSQQRPHELITHYQGFLKAFRTDEWYSKKAKSEKKKKQREKQEILMANLNNGCAVTVMLVLATKDSTVPTK